MVRLARVLPLGVLLLVIACSNPARAQVGQVDYSAQSVDEAKILEVLLEEKAWHFRCFDFYQHESFDHLYDLYTDLGM
ncbi:MAG: hypothetical protein AAGB26_08625 [Planctomycetota bacterium]